MESGMGAPASILNGRRDGRASLGWTAGAAVPTWITGSWVLSCVQRHTFQRFVNFYDAYLISQAGPTAKNFWIFLRGATGFFRRPVTQKNVMHFAVVIQAITAVSLTGKNG